MYACIPNRLYIREIIEREREKKKRAHADIASI